MTRPQAKPEGTKQAILQLLLREQLTPSDLARRLGVTPVAVRQHLATLSALGLVEGRRVRVGPSRPPEVYRLSPEGRRVFPKRYDLLLAELLEVLLSQSGADRTLAAVADAARRLAGKAPPSSDDSDRGRWTRLLAWLEQEFAWEADAIGPEGRPSRLVIHHCPFQDVSSRHREVCGVFFSTLVAALEPDARLEHVPDVPGEACCAFTVVGAAGRAGGKARKSGRRGQPGSRGGSARP
jgi:predicted ArsR family transcriptional regulator